MDEVRFREIFEQAMENEDPIRALGDLEFEIGTYLIEQLDQDKIKDPILKEKLMWYKAYSVLFDMESG